MTDSALETGSRQSGGPVWRTLYRVGGVAAVIAAVLFRRNLGAEVSLFTGQTPPVAAADWLTLLHTDRLLGLTFLNLFDVVNTALLGLLLLALYVALRSTHRSLMTLALALALVGVGVYFASNQSIALANVSDRYAAATGPEQAALLAAGETLLAQGNPGTASQGLGGLLGLLSVTLAALLTAIAMRRSPAFGRITAWLGILGNGVILLYFVALFAAPSLTFLPHTLGAIPLVLWELLSAWHLFRLARSTPPLEA